jgi:hypothetical protein
MAYRAIVAGHAFVSYSPIDYVYVRRLGQYLRDRGVDIWLHPDGAVDDWENLEASAAVIVVMTPESERSERVGHEITRAGEIQRPVRLVLLSGRPFDRFGDQPYEDVVGRRMPGDAFASELRKLAPGPLPEPLPAPSPTPRPSRRWVAALSALLRPRRRAAS